jgi:transcriptional regulator with XRE-family HTH domain
MDDNTTLGVYLRAQRERRGLTLRAISENTKVSLPLLEGLESDDIARWPGGIFRRAFVRSYAEAVGLDPDAVFRRFEQQHKPVNSEFPATDVGVSLPDTHVLAQSGSPRTAAGRNGASASMRTRSLGTAADLTVAMVLAFGSAAAGSRLLWPVLMIAAYYAIGILFTGTSPMVALLGQTASGPTQPRPVADVAEATDSDSLLSHSSARTIS